MTEPRPIEDVTWPDATPHSHADVVISIFCGNSRYHWALHEGSTDEFHPTLFWRQVHCTTEYI